MPGTQVRHGCYRAQGHRCDQPLGLEALSVHERHRGPPQQPHRVLSPRERLAGLRQRRGHLSAAQAASISMLERSPSPEQAALRGRRMAASTRNSICRPVLRSFITDRMCYLALKEKASPQRRPLCRCSACVAGHAAVCCLSRGCLQLPDGSHAGPENPPQAGAGLWAAELAALLAPPALDWAVLQQCCVNISALSSCCLQASSGHAMPARLARQVQ